MIQWTVHLHNFQNKNKLITSHWMAIVCFCTPSRSPAGTERADKISWPLVISRDMNWHTSAHSGLQTFPLAAIFIQLTNTPLGFFFLCPKSPHQVIWVFFYLLIKFETISNCAKSNSHSLYRATFQNRTHQFRPGLLHTFKNIYPRTRAPAPQIDSG